MQSIGKFVRKYEETSDMYGSITPLLLISYFLGVIPFRVIGPVDNRKLKFSPLGFFNAIVHIVIFSGCFVISLIKDESVSGYFFNTNISTIGDTLQKFSGLFGLTMLYTSSLYHKNAFMNLVNTLIQIDCRLEDLGVTINYAKTRRYSILFLLATIFVNGLFVFGSVKTICNSGFSPSFTAYVSYFSPQIIISLSVMLFMCFTHKLNHRFTIVNKIIQGISETRNPTTRSRSSSCESISLHTLQGKAASTVIDDLMEIHCLLCDAATTANEYFTYQLLTIVSISFLIILFDAYYILETILGAPRREIQFNTIEFVAFFSCQMVLYILAVFAIVEGGSKTIAQSEMTATFVHKLMNKLKDADLKQKLSYFSMQLIHEKISFTAAGLFNIDRTLYFTISGAATTYLIILLQFTSSGQTDRLLCPQGTNATQR